MENSVKFRKIRQIVGLTVLLVFFGLFALSFYSGQDRNGIFGAKGIAIKNMNLTPDLKRGDVAVTRKSEFNSLIKGDIVSYIDGVKNETAKIEEKTGESYKLSNGYNLKEENYLGRVVSKIPYLGFVYMFLETEAVFYIMILAFGIVILYNLTKNIRRDKELLRENANGKKKKKRLIFKKRIEKID